MISILGAIFGDIVGSVYEFDNTDDYNFQLLTSGSAPTDDSIMTIAVAKALIENRWRKDGVIYNAITDSLRTFGNNYRNMGYGSMFRLWLEDDDPTPYNSFGNGSAMRVSAVGWLYHSLRDTVHYARMSAFPTHNHPEGIRGAEAVATAIFLARNGHDKDFIRAWVNENYYDLSQAETFFGYFDETCQATVPAAINCFLNSTNYFDAIRKAVSICGDSDTIACITGGIAEAYYGIPQECRKIVLQKFHDCPDVLSVIDAFEKAKIDRTKMTPITRYQ